MFVFEGDIVFVFWYMDSSGNLEWWLICLNVGFMGFVLESYLFLVDDGVIGGDG